MEGNWTPPLRVIPRIQLSTSLQKEEVLPSRDLYRVHVLPRLIGTFHNHSNLNVWI
jgi:hypothetical protein